jgi:hypothetical protein
METNNTAEMLEVTELSVEDLDDVSGGCGHYDYHKPKHHKHKHHKHDCYDHKPKRDHHEKPNYGCH